MARKKRKKFDTKSSVNRQNQRSNDDFMNGWKLGKKAAMNELKQFIRDDGKKNLPFDTLMNTIDYIESYFKNDR